MAYNLTPAPRTYSYNTACDVVEMNFNPNYSPLADESILTLKHINDNVTFFYVGDVLVAMYDETSGDLWGAWSNISEIRKGVA